MKSIQASYVVADTFSLKDIRFYEALPAYEPTARTKAVQAKLGLKPDWRNLGSDRRSSAVINQGPIVIIAKRDYHDTEVEMHELGHVFMFSGGVDRSSWRRVFAYLQKNAPLYNASKDWRVVDGHPVFTGRGRGGADEAFADLFKLYFDGKLTFGNSSYGDVMKALIKVAP
jgi:hypothetical protein